MPASRESRRHLPVERNYFVNDDNSGRDGRRGRMVVMAGALAATALLVAACGGSSTASDSSTVGGSSAYQKALAYSECMRSNGDPGWLDPASNGTFRVKGGADSGPQYTSANSACKHLLPNGGQLTPAQQQQDANSALNFSVCMRSHGFPEFPDPASSGFNFGQIQSLGIDIKSPQFQSAKQTCQQVSHFGSTQ
jgi:hypothetical protein